MTRKGLISFDLDQTLVNTTKAHAIAFKKAFEQQGIKIKIKNVSKLIDGRHSYDVIKTLKPNLKKQIIKKIRRAHHYFLKKAIKYAKPIKGALRTLNVLKKNYKLALVTNCSSEESLILLKAAKIPKRIFDTIVLAENIRPKPWPDEIIKAEQVLHAKLDVHVGDSIYDIVAAKKAKAISIAVLTGQSPKKVLLKYKPDFIIKDVTHLPKVLSTLSDL